MPAGSSLIPAPPLSQPHHSGNYLMTEPHQYDAIRYAFIHKNEKNSIEIARTIDKFPYSFLLVRKQRTILNNNSNESSLFLGFQTVLSGNCWQRLVYLHFGFVWFWFRLFTPYLTIVVKNTYWRLQMNVSVVEMLPARTNCEWKAHSFKFSQCIESHNDQQASNTMRFNASCMSIVWMETMQACASVCVYAVHAWTAETVTKSEMGWRDSRHGMESLFCSVSLAFIVVVCFHGTSQFSCKFSIYFYFGLRPMSKIKCFLTFDFSLVTQFGVCL